MSRARAGGGDSLSTLQGALDRVCRVCTHQPRSKGLADDSVHTESTTHSSLLPKRSGRARLCSASESLHILIGVALGIGAGILADSLCAISVGDGSECTYLPEGGECEVAMALLSFPGELWMKALKALVLPLIVCNVALSACELRRRAGGGMIGRAVVLYYITTTVLASVQGALATRYIIVPFTSTVNASEVCAPQLPESRMETVNEVIQKSTLEQLLRVASNLVPENVVAEASGLNLLPLITTSILLGVLLPPADHGGVVLRGFEEVNAAVTKCVAVLVRLAPLGIGSVVFAALATNLSAIASVAPLLSVFLLAVLAGLASHTFLVLPLTYICATWGHPGKMPPRNPFTIMLNAWPALACALGSASSAAALPLTLVCAKKNHVSERVSRLVLPLGATINMDGTAIGYPCAAVFVALIQGTWSAATLGIADIIVVCVVSALCSMGAAPIPSAGLVLLVVTLETVGVPVGWGFALVVAVDWCYDRPETMINVAGDSLAAAIIETRYGKLLEESDKKLSGPPGLSGPGGPPGCNPGSSSQRSPQSAHTAYTAPWPPIPNSPFATSAPDPTIAPPAPTSAAEPSAPWRLQA